MPSDRPLSRRLVRLAALACGPGRAHRADLWPGLAIEGNLALYRGAALVALTPPSALLPAGRTLAVIGSGPSLARQCPERLTAGTAILCNGAASLGGRLRPAAVAIEDERFVHRRGAIVDALDADVPLLLSPAVLRALAAQGMRFEGRRVGLIRDLRRPLGGRKRSLAAPALYGIVRREGGAALSLAPDTGVVITGTVALSALQIALAADPETILLAGIDLSNAAEPRFNESAADRAPSGLAKGLNRILAGFALARCIAGERGIALTCASPVSASLALGYPRDASLDP